MRSTKDFLKDVFFLIEANSYESMCLWRENADSKSPLTWEQEAGMWEQIGELDGMPVCISMMPVRIAGKRILFWELTSQVHDYRMVEPFFEKNECIPKWDNGTRFARTDAMNFHHCLQAIRESK